MILEGQLDLDLILLTLLEAKELMKDQEEHAILWASMNSDNLWVEIRVALIQGNLCDSYQNNYWLLFFFN